MQIKGSLVIVFVIFTADTLIGMKTKSCCSFCYEKALIMGINYCQIRIIERKVDINCLLTVNGQMYLVWVDKDSVMIEF